MVLVTYKRVYYISDEDPTLAKVSSDLLRHSCLLARDGQAMHDGDEGSGGCGGGQDPLPLPLQKSHQGLVMSAGWSAGGRDVHERRVAGLSAATGPQEHHCS